MFLGSFLTLSCDILVQLQDENQFFIMGLMELQILGTVAVD